MSAADLTLEQKSKRLLLIIYKLAGGSTEVPVNIVEAYKEAARLRIFEMTDEEFESFRVRTVEEAHALDAEIIDA